MPKPLANRGFIFELLTLSVRVKKTTTTYFTSSQEYLLKRGQSFDSLFADVPSNNVNVTVGDDLAFA